MSCKRYEKQIALAISNDLPSRKTHTLLQHLGMCAECRAFESALRDGLRATRALADVNVSEITREAIVQNVMRNTIATDDRGRAGRAPHGWIATTAFAAVLMACWFMVNRNEPQIAVVKQAASIAVEKSEEIINTAPTVDESNAIPVQAALVKLYSENPNVVFYLVADNHGG
jgi:hypothetical protein